MKAILVFVMLVLMSSVPSAQGQSDVVPAAGGNIVITPIKHTSFQIAHASTPA